MAAGHSSLVGRDLSVDCLTWGGVVAGDKRQVVAGCLLLGCVQISWWSMQSAAVKHALCLPAMLPKVSDAVSSWKQQACTAEDAVCLVAKQSAALLLGCCWDPVLLPFSGKGREGSNCAALQGNLASSSRRLAAAQQAAADALQLAHKLQQRQGKQQHEQLQLEMRLSQLKASEAQAKAQLQDSGEAD